METGAETIGRVTNIGDELVKINSINLANLQTHTTKLPIVKQHKHLGKG